MKNTKKDRRISRRQFLGASGATIASVAAPKVLAAAERTKIVRAAIHPSIGVARVGNSRQARGFFIGPEVLEPSLTGQGQSRDSAGALKRQAARFRIFGYNSAGEVVTELTSDRADIKWSVHLANKKAAWYRSLAALDIPESRNLKAPRRNANVKGAARSGLVIDPGPRVISGKSQVGTRFRFDGRFFSQPVSLGELRTDERGRLIVLGGLGEAGSPAGMPVFFDQDEDTFNNADGWYDDTADGPVTATVEFGGVSLPVEPAWVIVGPPNYAPDILGWRTLHEILTNTYVAGGLMPVPAKTSFTRDILPIFNRLSNLQWVNQGFAKNFGKGAEFDFDDPKLIARLSNPAEREFHKQMYRSFRVSGQNRRDKSLWPMMYGDAYGSFPESLRINLHVPTLIEFHLKRWVKGDYVNDWSPRRRRSYRRLTEVPLRMQPAVLDQAALHFCIADAFHPGCELTWPMRNASMYSAPFRIKHRDPGVPEPDYGEFLTTKIVLDPRGPLQAQGPGDLTKWMAIPWQGDTVFCRSGYEPEFDPYLPSYWPARVPNHVLSAGAYDKVMDTRLPREERLAAFQSRESWVRWMKGAAADQIMQMTRNFGQMGVVEARPGFRNDPDFPPVIFVESVPPSLERQDRDHSESKSAPRGGESPVEQRVREAGWESIEQLREFRRIKRIP